MNEESFKSSLLEMIKEAENLPESSLENIPGTRIRVKKGRTDEFKANARFYYMLKNNVTVNNDDYLKEVYYDLSDEVARDEAEHIISRAHDLSLNQSELERLDALNKAISENTRKKQEAENKIKSVSNAQELEKITNELKEILENETILKNSIIEIKNKVNEEVKKIIEEEMNFLKESYLNTSFGTEASILGAPWNVTVLKKDEETYKTLFAISKILENVNDQEQIIVVNNVLCVNPSQEEIIKEHLSKLDLFKLAEPIIKEEKTQKVESPKEVNSALLKKISEELDRLRAKIAEENLPSDQLEYDNLIKISQYLNKAQNQDFALTPVWNIAYVNGADRQAFIQLLRKTAFFEKDNPELKMIQENEVLISKLQAYLNEIENKFNHYVGKYNIPVAQVGDTIILKEDEEEYRNVTEIIKILENSKENLITISAGGNVSYDLYPKYKELLSKTKYFAPTKTLDLEDIKKQNAPILAQIQNDIQELKKSGENNNPEKASLIRKQLDTLMNVDENKELVEVNGAMINKENEAEYRKIIEELANLKNTPDMIEEESILGTNYEASNEPVFSPISPDKSLQVSTESPINISVSKDTKEKENLKRSVVKAIRKAKDPDWWKKNGKKVAIVGLSTIAVLYALSTLGPTLVYANSCLAMANPALSGILGSINSTIINTFGLTLGELNLNVAATHAFTAWVSAAANLGVLGVGITGIVKGLNGPKENRLPDPNRKNVARKILDLGENLISKSKDLSRTLADKASAFTENLAYATDAKNMELNKEAVNAQMRLNQESEQPVDEKTFAKITENVQKAIDDEQKEAEKRINERFNRLSEEPIILEEVPEEIKPLETPVASFEEPKPVTVAIPTDDEIMSQITDKSLELARTDNYIDAIKSGDKEKAKVYQEQVFDNTGIDLSKYDMSVYEEEVQARSDVANFMNQISITKRSR